MCIRLLSLLSLVPLLLHCAPSVVEPPSSGLDAGRIFAPAPHSPFRVGPHAGPPQVADLNGDGHLDVALSSHAAPGPKGSAPPEGFIVSLLGDGRGGFRPAPGSPFAVGSPGDTLALGDLDGDGHPDAAVAHHDSYDVVVLLGDRKGGFARGSVPTFRASEGRRPHTHAVTIGDVDGDGHQDVLTTNADDDNVSVLLGDGKGRLAPAAGSPVPAGTHPYAALALADFDGDGRPDLVTPNLKGDAVSVLLGGGAGAFAPAAGSPVAVGPRPGFAVAGRVDGDRSFDIVATHDDDPLLAVLLGDGKGGFRHATGSPLRLPMPVWGAALGDLDRDGKTDAVLGSFQGKQVVVLCGEGAGRFRPAPRALSTGNCPGHVALADLDGDGKLDLLASDYDGGTLAVLLGR